MCVGWEECREEGHSQLGCKCCGNDQPRVLLGAPVLHTLIHVCVCCGTLQCVVQAPVARQCPLFQLSTLPACAGGVGNLEQAQEHWCSTLPTPVVVLFVCFIACAWWLILHAACHVSTCPGRCNLCKLHGGLHEPALTCYRNGTACVVSCLTIIHSACSDIDSCMCLLHLTGAPWNPRMGREFGMHGQLPKLY